MQRQRSPISACSAGPLVPRPGERPAAAGGPLASSSVPAQLLRPSPAVEAPPTSPCVRSPPSSAAGTAASAAPVSRCSSRSREVGKSRVVVPPRSP